MRFLVVSYGIEPLDFAEVGEAAPRSHRYRDRLVGQGKLVEHAHISGHRGHAWIFDVDSVDELDRVISDDPMTAFSQNDALILPLCSYERMSERERQMLGVPAEAQTDMAALERQARSEKKGGSMRFLVIAYGQNKLNLSKIGDAPARANRYREELMRQGKLSLHGHIAGQKGHVWLYHVDSVDELDVIMSEDPMSSFHQNDPKIFLFCSYERMHDREKRFFGEFVEH